MAEKRKRGRPTADGAKGITDRMNITLTKEHKQKLEAMATEGVSPWVRSVIDKEWNQFKEGNSQ